MQTIVKIYEHRIYYHHIGTVISYHNRVLHESSAAAAIAEYIKDAFTTVGFNFTAV